MVRTQPGDQVLATRKRLVQIHFEGCCGWWKRTHLHTRWSKSSRTSQSKRSGLVQLATESALQTTLSRTRCTIDWSDIKRATWLLLGSFLSAAATNPFYGLFLKNWQQKQSRNQKYRLWQANPTVPLRAGTCFQTWKRVSVIWAAASLTQNTNIPLVVAVVQ